VRCSNSQPMDSHPPAQLVRNAHAHGVEVRAVDACVTHWDRRAVGERALRPGLRLRGTHYDLADDRDCRPCPRTSLPPGRRRATMRVAPPIVALTET
jgi:hypothetical protein